ncbi:MULTISPECIES: adenylate/guanylate cyclase domain-containing protein [unclassified Brevundimonas]|uniref:adenylate/guanylate cyclase domain-containing protein n=1 Tax=unclassified Brevundimonas TaxID=2622653 RepID=UPI003F9268AA
MAAHTWTSARAAKRIAARLKEVETVEIKDYVRETDLSSLPRTKAYRVNGVHIYVDIKNLDDMLGASEAEGVLCHKRTLRFLNLHYRAVHRILRAVGAIEVDFHNQRLHAVVAKPYGDEIGRIHRAVAIAQLIIDVLAQTGEEGDEIIPAAKVRVGIDSGVALAVCNGRRGHAEPLFLGAPANLAAKRAGGGTVGGIYLTNTARGVIGLADDIVEDRAPLSAEEVAYSQDDAGLEINADQIVKAWRADLEANPIGKFGFSGHTPPFSNLDFELLSPSASRRQDAISLYADIDGFTDFVAAGACDDDSARNVVRVLHVLRSEMDAVLDKDFEGRKVRFVGDCVHGVLGEGTAQTTDLEESVSTAALCAAAIRSSFDQSIAALEDDDILSDGHGLGLAIGFELGPIALTRLGVKGSMIRCAVGRNVLASEAEQRRCAGDQTAIGQNAYDEATSAVQTMFGSSRKRSGLVYDTAVDELAGRLDETAKASKALAKSIAVGATVGLVQTTAAPAADYAFANRRTEPSKPAGFA